MNKTAGVLVVLVGLAGTTSADTAPQNPFDLYKRTVEVMAASKAWSVHAEKQFDVVLHDGAKVQYSGAMDLLVNRDGAMYLDYGDDLSAREAWYDGTSLTLLDLLNNVYAQVPAEGKVGEMLSEVNQRFGLELPMAPLLNPELAADFEAYVENATYLGLHDVDGEPCHHALYRGTNIDLQVWITTDDQPLLRKLVATFWQIDGAPQQSLLFTDWNLDVATTPEDFQPTLPDDAIRTEFLPLEDR